MSPANGLLLLLALAQTGSPVGPPNAFFAMDTATRDDHHQTVESQLRLVKELGFAGWACSLQDMREPLKIADELGLKIFAVYAGLDLDKPENPYDPKLPDAIRALKGRGTAVWLFVLGKKPSGEADDGAVEGIRRIADLAAESELEVSLYPHNGFYVASTRDAIRLVEKVKRRNVKLTFNLCHWLKVDGGRDLDGILRDARPHLSIISINGANRQGENWDDFIKPLGDGDFDVAGLLGKLRRVGFAGPVGLQGYGVKGDVRVHLARAMKSWRDYTDPGRSSTTTAPAAGVEEKRRVSATIQ